jgi:hypothetical protein
MSARLRDAMLRITVPESGILLKQIVDKTASLARKCVNTDGRNKEKCIPVLHFYLSVRYYSY